MAIDSNKFKYKIGDLVRSKSGAEYQIVNIQTVTRTYSSLEHYRLKNLSSGCLDSPYWVTGSIIYSKFEPCNPAIKVLFDRGSEATNPPSAKKSE